MPDQRLRPRLASRVPDGGRASRRILLLLCICAGVFSLVLGAPVGVTALAGAERPGEAEVPEKWESPVGQPMELLRGYEPPPHPYGAGHRGVDLAAAGGQAVIAPADGVVSFSGPVAGRGVLSIRVDEQTVLSMEPVETPLGKNAPVQRGHSVGVVAAGGHCASACLHLGVRVDGEYVNPMRYLAGVPELLPW